MYGLAILSDSQLMEVYKQAIEINLDQDFINILAAELDKRELDDLSLFKEEHSFLY